MVNIIKNYSIINSSVLNMISAEFFIQLINQSFMLILMIYMAKCGYHDSQCADFFSYRFLGVLLLSLPLGYYIKGRKLKPLFYFSSVMTPGLSIFIVLAIDSHQTLVLYILQFCWGICYMCMHAFSIPYVLRNTPPDVSMETISLVYSTASLGGIVGGLSIFFLSNFLPAVFDEKTILILISGLGFVSLFFVSRIKADDSGEIKKEDQSRISYQDVLLLIQAIFPSALLAVGAGLTIPFVGLFFYHVHGMDSDSFALLSSFTTTIVFFSFLIVPWVKQRFGSVRAVLISQGLAVFFLINLALTQMYSTMAAAVLVACICYIIRRPLMLMAAPMTTAIAMRYVGEKNRELMGALIAANWSGSWFISSKIFFYLRRAEVDYVWVFLITAAIYIVSMISFYFIILKSDRFKNI